MKHKAVYFYLFCVTIFIGFCSPFLFAEGMFFDGVIYAAIGKNLALGKGSFWNPFFTETFYAAFHEHPPFVFGIESVLFRIFGTESTLVERFFSVGSYIIVGFLIVKIWKLICHESRTAWFALLLYVLIPTVTWAATNNLLENTMSVFVVFGAYLYLKGFGTSRRFIYTIFCGLMLFLGVFSKGFVALFVCSLPFWTFLFAKKISFKQCVTDTLVIISFTLSPFVLMMALSETVYNSLFLYLDSQVFASLRGDKVTVDSRFFILWKFLNDIIYPLIVVSLLILIFRLKKIKLQNTKKYAKPALLFLLLGFSCILPIMLSTKQRGFYILPSFPFFAIAIGLFVQPYLLHFVDSIKPDKIGFKIFKIVSVVLLIGVSVFAITRIGTFGRDKKQIQVVMKCGEYVLNNSIISINPELYDNWDLHAYFIRKKGISVDASIDRKHDFYLCKEEFEHHVDNQLYTKIDEINGFLLFQKNTKMLEYGKK